jgi:hypothetical protein
LAIAPSERRGGYEWFSEEPEYFEIDGYSDLPLLGDQGAALEAHVTCRKLFHCFHHIDEKFASGSYVAQICKRLLFTTVKARYITKFPQAWSDLQGSVEREMLIRTGHDSFCDLFGGLGQPNKFDAESLWVRGPRGVSTCSKHVERLNRQARPETCLLSLSALAGVCQNS